MTGLPPSPQRDLTEHIMARMPNLETEVYNVIYSAIYESIMTSGEANIDVAYKSRTRALNGAEALIARTKGRR